MTTKPLPDEDVLNQLLRYEPETGRLFWRPRPVEMFSATSRAGRGEKTAEQNCAGWNAVHADTEAFTSANERGYFRGILWGEGFKAHRIIYKMVHGADPEYIDHINMVRSDNRLCNLRSVTHAENCAHFTGPPKRAAA